MKESLAIRILMGHEIHNDYITFFPIPSLPGNALNQFEKQLKKIVNEEKLGLATHYSEEIYATSRES